MSEFYHPVCLHCGKSMSFKFDAYYLCFLKEGGDAKLQRGVKPNHVCSDCFESLFLGCVIPKSDLKKDWEFGF